MALPVSPLARPLPNLPDIAGVRLGAVAAGIRYQGRTDLVMAEFAPGTTGRACSRATSAPCAPGGLVPGVAGGRQGEGARGQCRQCQRVHRPRRSGGVRATAVAASVLVGGPVETGVPRLHRGDRRNACRHARLTAAIPGLHARACARWVGGCGARIMTTDTFPKAATAGRQHRRRRGCGFSGFAKGSGMIAPDMATMLCFVATDAKIPAALLQDAPFAWRRKLVQRHHRR